MKGPDEVPGASFERFMEGFRKKHPAWFGLTAADTKKAAAGDVDDGMDGVEEQEISE